MMGIGSSDTGFSYAPRNPCCLEIGGADDVPAVEDLDGVN
jgi:hypothetical protein